MDNLIEEFNRLYRYHLNEKLPMIETQISKYKEIANNKQNKVVDVEYAKGKLQELEVELIKATSFKDGIHEAREVLIKYK